MYPRALLFLVSRPCQSLEKQQLQLSPLGSEVGYLKWISFHPDSSQLQATGPPSCGPLHREILPGPPTNGLIYIFVRLSHLPPHSCGYYPPRVCPPFSQRPQSFAYLSSQPTLPTTQWSYLPTGLPSQANPQTLLLQNPVLIGSANTVGAKRMNANILHHHRQSKQSTLKRT